MNMSEQTIDECVFDFIYEIALNDATNRVSEEGDKARILENEDIKKAVKEYKTNILNATAVYNNLFCETVEKIRVANERRGKGNKVENLTFGKIQKLINMTMKYVYIEYFRSSDKKKPNFAICHAPMDSIMRDFVFVSHNIVRGKSLENKENPGFTRDCSWSKLPAMEGPYQNFQEAIDSIIEVKNLGINRIEFDYLFWDKARALQGKRLNEQWMKAEEIWREY